MYLIYIYTKVIYYINIHLLIINTFILFFYCILSHLINNNQYLIIKYQL